MLSMYGRWKACVEMPAHTPAPCLTSMLMSGLRARASWRRRAGVLMPPFVLPHMLPSSRLRRSSQVQAPKSSSGSQVKFHECMEFQEWSS